MVEEFLTRVDMALTYIEHRKLQNDVKSLTDALKKEVEMNAILAEALSQK